MAVSHSWFQNWQPPTSLITEHRPFHRDVDHTNIFTEDYERAHPRGTSNNMLNYLPYFLSMSIYTTGNKEQEPKKDAKIYYKPRHQARPLETTGPFKTWYRWKQLDFAFETEADRERAIFHEEYVPKNNLPLGLDVHKDRLFITLPKWKSGIPCTLAVLPKVPKEPSPLLVPYPSWDWHNSDSYLCKGLVSVFRVQVDTCNRLWVLDSGQIHISVKPEQVCPPQILIFDLNTDSLLLRYEIPKEFVKEDSLYSNIVVDIREGDCEDVHAYLADVWRFGLVVFSLKQEKSWRVTDHLFYPDPLAAAYKIHDLEFEWTDGIFSLALSPEVPRTTERLLYFHPMSSFREFYVKTSIICNETGWMSSKNGFKVLGESRGKNGHASAAGMDKNGILFYNLVSQDSIACWDSRKSYSRSNLGIIAKSNTTLVFPNDLKIDRAKRSSIWIITNRLPYYLYRSLNENDYNFRIMSTYVDEAIRGTICDPSVSHFDSFDYVEDGEDCY